MTRDEARAELVTAFLEGTVGDVLVESDVERIIDAMLARPELVLAALGTERMGTLLDWPDGTYSVTENRCDERGRAMFALPEEPNP